MPANSSTRKAIMLGGERNLHTEASMMPVDMHCPCRFACWTWLQLKIKEKHVIGAAAALHGVHNVMQLSSSAAYNTCTSRRTMSSFREVVRTCLSEKLFFKLQCPSLVSSGSSCQVANVSTLQHHLHASTPSSKCT